MGAPSEEAVLPDYVASGPSVLLVNHDRVVGQDRIDLGSVALYRRNPDAPGDLFGLALRQFFALGLSFFRSSMLLSFSDMRHFPWLLRRSIACPGLKRGVGDKTYG
jgi:hypothetical protein